MEKKENSIQGSHFDTWWLEITTAVPSNIHNFGPFRSEKEARVSQYERVQDLITKKSHGITVKVKNSPPEKLAVSKNLEIGTSQDLEG